MVRAPRGTGTQSVVELAAAVPGAAVKSGTFTPTGTGIIGPVSAPAENEVAILFADVSDSTGLFQKLGDKTALAAIESVLEIARRAVAAHRGRIVKTIGDEIMAILPSADAALEAASDLQFRVAALPPANGQPLAVHVGFHLGPVIEEKGDVYGDAVNIAARMVEVAKGRQIITSEYAVEKVSPGLQVHVRNLDVLTVRGSNDDIRIYEVVWEENDDTTLVTSIDVPGEVRDNQLSLGFNGKTVTMGREHSVVLIGRDPMNHVVVLSHKASRMHGRIERRRNQFFLVDQSTNGTYVTVGNEPEVMVRREQMMLRGSGVLCFGHSRSDPAAEPVQFMVEEKG